MAPMYLRLTSLSVILAAGMLQALFLASVFLAHRRGNRRANSLLAAQLGLFALVILNGFLYQTNLYQDWPDLIGIPAAFQLLVGPLFLWYVRALVDGQAYRFRRRDLLHLIPFGVYFVLELSFLFHNGFYKMALMYSWLSNQRAVSEYVGRFWYQLFVPLQTWVYLALVARAIRRHEVSIRQVFSNIEDRTLGWLRNALVAFTVGLVGVTLSVVFPLAGIQVGWMMLCAPLADTALVYYLAWVAFLRRPQDADPQALPAAPAAMTEPKYEKSSLSDEQAQHLLGHLETLMQTRRPHTNPDLTLATLAGQLKTSRNHLSRILNQKLGTTFYDYTNRHRVLLAGETLRSENAPANILDIATACGFKSKSTFNKAFKSQFGVSPSEYRRARR